MTTGSKSHGNEPVEYFREMLNHNLPIDAFQFRLTMANARLDFYGMPEPKTEDFNGSAFI